MNNSQIKQLAKQLAKVQVSVPAKAGKSKKKKRGTKKGSGNIQEGTIRFSKTELLVSIEGNNGNVVLSPNSFPFLRNLSSSFERYRWEKLIIHYKPSVGSVVAGAITFGVDWSHVSLKTDRAGISAYSPVYDSPVWQTGKLVLPIVKLASRREYILDAVDVNDASPGTLCWASTNKAAVGDLWIEYSITMLGTR